MVESWVWMLEIRNIVMISVYNIYLRWLIKYKRSSLGRFPYIAF